MALSTDNAPPSAPHRARHKRSLLLLAAGLSALALAQQLSHWLLDAPEGAARPSITPEGHEVGRPDAPQRNVGQQSGAASLWQQPPVAQPTTVYTLKARLDPDKHTVTGSGTLRWRNTSARPQRELWLHLYLNAFASDDTVFMRTEAGRGFRGDGVPADLGSITVERLYAGRWKADLWPEQPHTPDDPNDATDIRVPLPEPVLPGETLSLELAWTSQLPRVSHRTGFSGSFHMVAQWFPKLARLEPDGHWAHFPFHRLGEFYSDFGDYHVTIEAPQGYLVGHTGRAAPPQALDDGYARYEAHIERVHDFAFTAWDGFAEQRDEHGGVSLRCLYPRGDDDLAGIQLAYVKRALDHFGARYGPYPYETLTLVQPPEDAADAGGMEYPTLITTGGRWLPAALDIRFLANVTVHELGHQWFYGLLASHEHRWPFLDEGLTTFAQNDAMETFHPHASGAQLLGLSVSNHAVARLVARQREHHGAIARSVTEYASGGDYGALVYQRTSLLLETLARSYGRERLRRALHHYATGQRFAHPTPDELLASLERELGREAAEAARVALFERGWLDYRLSDLRRLPAEDGEYRGSVLLRRLGTLQLPVDVLLVDEAGKRQRVRHPASPKTHARLQYRGAAPLAYAQLDPEHTLLLDQSLANNLARHEGRQPAHRVTSHTAYLVQLLASTVAP